jgi:TolB-like protein/tetratricopeptide (TPR) repeat protein
MKCPKCHSENPDASRFCGRCAAPLDAEAQGGASVTKTLAAPVHGLAKGTTVAGKYRILEEIGRGGMGIVYKAEDTKLQRTVALKFLPPQWTSDPEARERFIHEARAASALDHPNICTIYEIGETEDGRMYIAMGCYEGESLREKLRRGPMKAEEALGVTTQVALGMEKAHGKGIIHRDIKPANILITNDGVAKIVDFGLAKLAGQVRMTKEGTTVGTVAYMSPEQAKGEPVDQRTDIWSLGVVLYETVSGRLPFKGDYEQSLIHSILRTDPEHLGKIRKDLPKGLESIVLKALAKNPNARYQDMGEVLEDLKAVSEGVKPLRAKAGLFRGKVFGIRKIYAYAGLAILASVIVLLTALNVGGLRDRLLGRVNTPRITSLAVLPVKNYTGDPSQEFFADGMTEALIDSLGQIKALKKVTSRTSAMHYKGTSETLPQIARELGVDGIVEASVTRSASRVGITARLIDARQDRQLCTRNYEREMTDVLILRSELVQAIADEIRVQVTPQESERLKTARPVDPRAYEACLRGRYFLGKWTPDGLKKAITEFQNSIDIEPAFASAYAGLADAYNRAAAFYFQLPNEAFPKARAAARKALELDEQLAEAHVALARVMLQFDWNWAGAEQEYQQAITLNPNSFEAHFGYGFYLTTMGRADEAVNETKRALDLDPLTATTSLQLGWVLYYARRHDESIAQLKKTLDLAPDLAYAYIELSWNYAQKRMYPEAVAECQRAIRLSPEDQVVLSSCGRVYGLAGERADALKCLESLKGLSARGYVDPYNMAWFYDGLGEDDRTLEWLERAYRERSASLIGLRIEILSDSLRSNPRFQELLRGMNFSH